MTLNDFLIILGGSLCYLIVAIVIHYVNVRFGKASNEDAGIAFGWAPVLIVLCIIGPFFLLSKLSEWVGNMAKESREKHEQSAEEAETPSA